jgi:hypothetical protein
VAPSLTTLEGKTAIRAAIVNHRTERDDIEALITGVIAAGRRRSNKTQIKPSLEAA